MLREPLHCAGRRIRGASLLLAAFLLAGGFPSQAQDSPAASRPIPSGNISVRHEVQRAIDRGLSWLENNQHAEGHWSGGDHTAITALALTAFMGDPQARYKDLTHEGVRKGYDFLLGHAQPDGGIYNKKELLNYNTAVSMMALLAAERPEYRPVLLKARQFIIGLQSDFGELGELDTPFDGGIGYGNTYPHSDLSNTLMALEALYYSRHLVEDQAIAGARDLNWKAAIEFIQSCQNLPSHNRQPWASDDPANKGGFVYFPGHSMAGETNLPSGRVALRSYGSISYAGLLSYIYADLKPEDPRVQAALDWLRKNYTLEENPGMGQQGLFYYFHTMAKALNTVGIERLKTADGTTVDWRQELALHLINLQQSDGSWLNETGRWWEGDPALVTSYAVIALEVIHRGM